MKGLFLLTYLLLFFSNLNSQSFVLEAPKEFNISDFLPEALLWDNTNINPSESGIASTLLKGRHPDSSLVQAADDFVVPADFEWVVDSIWVRGFTALGVATPPFYGLVIYSDNNGKPGNEIYRAELPNAYGTAVATTVKLIPVQPLIIPEGKHWLSVYGSYPSPADNLTYWRWNWVFGSTAVGSPAQLRDSTGLFGIPPFPWTSISTLGVPSANSLLFRIHGTPQVIPVELISFTAAVENNNVYLKWSTATETNNRGFEVHRSETKGEWMSIGFVAGNGTTTEPKNYSFTDRNITTGKYVYRLKQVDYDGTFEYSNVIEIDVSITPKVFSLEQNYPNPFNPSTNISYALPFASSVNISIYNIIGEKIKELVSTAQNAGYYNVVWNADEFSSGVYFYILTAKSNEGDEYRSIKKMLLMK
jgi:hypothetical protein